MIKHTPTPWAVAPEYKKARSTVAAIVGPDGLPLVVSDGESYLERALAGSPEDMKLVGSRKLEDLQHIVRCVNARDALVAALEYAKERLIIATGSSEPEIDDALKLARGEVQS